MPKPKRVMQDQNIAVFAALFFDHVQAGDAKIHAALSHADDNVAGPLEDDAKVREGRYLRLILPRVGLEHAQTSRGQKIERVHFEPALRR